jgi:enoyl-CoA hydratase
MEKTQKGAANKSRKGKNKKVTGIGYQLEKPVEETVLYDKVDKHIAVITLNRPEVGNSIYPPDMFIEIQKKVEKAEADDDIKVILLKGAGHTFCTGDDLNKAPYEAMGATPTFRPPQSWRMRGIRWFFTDVYRTLIYCEKTIISQVHGWAIGAGVDLMLCSDLAVAADTAKIANRQMRIGFAGFQPATTMLSMLTLGLKRHREWLLTGRTITAEEAREWGLINEVVPEDQLDKRGMEWAQAVAAHSTDGLMVGKYVTHMMYDLLGMNGSLTATSIAHPLFTNLKWRDDEFNFLKVRSEKGSTEAFRLREKIWGDLGFE